MEAPKDLKLTPLAEQHERLNAKMIDYAGWRMPVQYAGIQTEHQAVRQSAGLFDVSHMGEFLIAGPAAAAFLNHLLPRDLSRFQPGQARYSPMCAANGGTVDDLIIYPLEPDNFLLVVNAANTGKDLAHILTVAAAWSERPDQSGLPPVMVTDISADFAQLALQGPLAAGITLRLAGMTDNPLVRGWPDLSGATGLRPYQYLWQADSCCLISRTGYTGEDGFEFYLPPALAPDLWLLLLELGAVPAGLGARDSLRLEAGMPLYGHELGPDITPLEAGLQRFVDLEKSGPGFVGQQALKDSLTRRRLTGEPAPARRLVGLRSAGRAIPRADYPVLLDSRPIGHVTSGVFSPSFALGIAMALVDFDANLEQGIISVLVREREEPFIQCPLPFYRRPGQ